MDKIAVLWLVITFDFSVVFKLQILKGIVNNTAHSILFVGYAQLNTLRKISTETVLKLIYSVFSEYLTK